MLAVDEGEPDWMLNELLTLPEPAEPNLNESSPWPPRRASSIALVAVTPDRSTRSEAETQAELAAPAAASAEERQLVRPEPAAKRGEYGR